MSNPTYHDGQEVTVIDAKGVRGPGKVIKAYPNGNVVVAVGFDHFAAMYGERRAGSDWNFMRDGIAPNVSLRIEPHPFTEEAPVSGVDPRDAETLLPASAGVCAYDLDEATVTIALDNEADVRALIAKLPSRRRAALSPDPVEGEEK